MKKDNPFKLPRRLIRKYGTSDPFYIAEMEGIQVIMRDDFVKQKGAFAVVLNNRFIFINNNLSRPMKLIVCAHELGHALRHWRLCKRIALYEMKLFDMRDPLEREANLFAAGLLIDEGRLMECLMKGYSIQQAAMELETIPDLVTILLQEMKDRMELPENIPVPPRNNFLGTVQDEDYY